MARIRSKKEISMKNLILFVLFSLSSSSLFAKLNVVTTTTDLAALTSDIGGQHVAVTAITKGYQDPHFVEAKPSYLLKMRKADLFIQVGLELEVAWAPALLTNARNPKILPGSPGFLEASSGCEILQKQTGPIDRSLGDVHPFGNPHFWLDPENGRQMARNIAERLKNIDPTHSKNYDNNLAVFESRLNAKEKEWSAQAASLQGLKVVTYHNSWPNFAKRFGLNVLNFIEPKPGIPASPAHIKGLINQIKDERIKLILIEPYFDEKLPAKIAADTGAKLVIFPPSVEAFENIKTYFDLFDTNLRLLKENL